METFIMTANNYKFSWKAIYDSWAKLIRIHLNMQKLSIQEKKIIANRVAVCDNCDKKKLGICTACGCPLPAKIIKISNKCKLNKWE